MIQFLGTVLLGAVCVLAVLACILLIYMVAAMHKVLNSKEEAKK